MKRASCSAPIVLALLAVAGCDSCAKKESKVPAPSGDAAVSGPVIVAADGSKVQAASVFTEEIAGQVAGP
ncbi:MAG TPA: hypothetical protein VM925_34695, partial [Labilithrix sp.]|nr:hypothetical protein [Labilithrix sp.]